MPLWIRDFWDWFWYYRRGKIKFTVYGYEGNYEASAGNGKTFVWHCYGNTPEAAKEMALFKLKQALEEMQKEH
ncbi:hypothetical protein [Neobacillus sp. 114]|uniref:hypothetical protein n=1 Tax=Neobacillus sp. 114 TaxID=3048535 RepID=UPI0024C368C6|nr:hypothetical protein [Neobacillus sp. 114]